MSKRTLLLSSIVTFIVLIIISILLYKEKQSQSLVFIPTFTPTPSPIIEISSPTPTVESITIPVTPIPMIPHDWKNYTNKGYHYSLWYPPDWRINNTRAEPDSQVYSGTYLTLFSPEGNILTFEYDHGAMGAVPLHIYKSMPVMVAGDSLMKTYNDGCNFTSQGMESPSYYDCTGKSFPDRGIFKITYGLSKDIENDTIPEYTTLRGKYALLQFSFNKHVPLGMENMDRFKQVDTTLNTIVSSIVFSY